jgi:hypothetical protein
MKYCILELILGITQSQQTIRGDYNKNKCKYIYNGTLENHKLYYRTMINSGDIIFLMFCYTYLDVIEISISGEAGVAVTL